MSAVIADPSLGAVPLKRGKKKLLVMVAIGMALALALFGGAVVYFKQKAAHAAAEAADEEGGAGEHGAAAKIDAKNVPVYLPLDPFIVNLADKETDRYAQIGVTFELENNGSVEELRAFMPSIRNAILMILANKTSRDLIDRAGKEQLADEILRGAVRPMGIEVAAPEAVVAAAPAASAAVEAASGASGVASMPALTEIPRIKAKGKRLGQKNPIQHVHFSSFIIQ
jgi:flagellar protein FliL